MKLLKCSIQYVNKFGKLSNGHRTGKRLIFILVPKKGNTQECSNSTWMEDFQKYKLDLEKAKEPKIKLPAFAGS